MDREQVSGPAGHEVRRTVRTAHRKDHLLGTNIGGGRHPAARFVDRTESAGRPWCCRSGSLSRCGRNRSRLSAATTFPNLSYTAMAVFVGKAVEQLDKMVRAHRPHCIGWINQRVRVTKSAEIRDDHVIPIITGTEEFVLSVLHPNQHFDGITARRHVCRGGPGRGTAQVLGALDGVLLA